MDEASPDSELMKASEGLQKKLDLIERIRGDLETERISVPGIVVCGSQSAGKSSTMESICGFHFPTGEGMCTRCPAIVSLQVDPFCTERSVLVSGEPDFNDVEACEIHDVAAKIEEITNDRCQGSMVSKDPIYIRITSASGPVLTLTDIPGITAVSKEQDDIGVVTEAITRQYINQEGMVVLVVIPGWEDFGNPLALKLAKDADPSGERTIGVVTKVDCLPSNSDIVQKIRMERATDVELAQGFIAVRNRNKEEVAADVPDKVIREREADLFNTDPKLSQLQSSMWGVPTLVNKIVDIQMKVVTAFIPELMSTLRGRIRDLEAEKKKLPIILSSNEEKLVTFNGIAQDIMGSFSALKDSRQLFNEPFMNICARLHEFSCHFERSVKEGLPDFLHDDYREKLLDFIKETRGINLANFMSGPAIIVKSCAEYPLLAALLQDSVELEVEQGKSEVNDIISILVEAENDVALTLNPEYMKAIEAFKSNMLPVENHEGDQDGGNFNRIGKVLMSFLENTRAKLQHQTDNTSADIYEMQVSLHCYANVKKERLIDHIVMFVRHFLLTRLSKKVGDAIWKTQNYQECLNPDPDVLRQSLRIERTLDRLKKVQLEVKKVL